MAKCLVLCLLVLLQTSLLVLGEETTTKDASDSESDTTSKMLQTEPLADEPTRVPSKIQTTMPPLVHAAAKNVTAAIDTVKNSTKSMMNSSEKSDKSENHEKQKGAAPSLFSSIQIVIVSVIGVFLSASAI